MHSPTPGILDTRTTPAEELSPWRGKHQRSPCMVVNGAPEKLSPSPQRWQLEGRQIPICVEYRYLGMRFLGELKVPLVMRTRLEKRETNTSSDHTAFDKSNDPRPYQGGGGGRCVKSFATFRGRSVQHVSTDEPTQSKPLSIGYVGCR